MDGYFYGKLFPHTVAQHGSGEKEKFTLATYWHNEKWCGHHQVIKCNYKMTYYTVSLFIEQNLSQNAAAVCEKTKDSINQVHFINSTWLLFILF